MAIPRIIHQTWTDANVAEDFRNMAISWREKHTGWKYCFWTNEQNRNFIKDYFPLFLRQFDGYAYDIQRVDAVKYFVLLKYGGVYVDMDIRCFRNITPLITRAECVFGKEPEEHCVTHQKELIISTAFMGASPANPFVSMLCAELENDRQCFDNPNDLILETTGPFMLTRIYKLYGHKGAIKLLEPDVIYPLTKTELERLSQLGAPDEGMRHKLERAYGVHYYAGTWWKRKATVDH